MKRGVPVIENPEPALLQGGNIEADAHQLEPYFVHQHTAQIGILGVQTDPRVAAVVEIRHQIELNIPRLQETAERLQQQGIVLARGHAAEQREHEAGDQRDTCTPQRRTHPRYPS